MNFSQLKTFLLLAEGLTVTETAERLHCTQPSVSIRLKKLEDELQTVLFERLNNRLFLTPQGKLYQQYASQIINIIDVSFRHMRQFDDPYIGEIKLGASHFIGVYFLPKIIGLFKKKYPLVKISIDIAKSHHLISKLNHQELDLLVIADDIPFDQDEYILKTFLVDPLVLICSPNHRLAKNKTCSLSEVTNESFLIKPEHSATRRFLMDKIRSGSDTQIINSSMEIDSIEGIKQSVIHELGISIVSSIAVEQEVRANLLCALTIDDINLNRGVRYVHHKNKHLSPATYNLLMLLEQEGFVE